MAKSNQSIPRGSRMVYLVRSPTSTASPESTPEDLEAEDMMARAYPNHPHPAHRHHLQHVGNAGEYHVLGTTFTADGFHYETNTVYEFHGCFWHGCPKCYPVRHEKHLRLCDRTMQDVYEKTQAKIATLLGKGYNVLEMWECQWSQLKQTNPDVLTYVHSLQFVEPLNPRDAFCGGRTNAIKLYHRVTPDQNIHYIDYTSLYPWATKRASTPKVIPCSSRSRVTQTSAATSGSRNVKCYPHADCTILCSLIGMEANSPFLYALPA